VLTGGGSGISKMMAHAFAANGAARVYIAARKESQLRQAAEEINGAVGRQDVVRWLTANVGVRFFLYHTLCSFLPFSLFL